MPDPAPNSDRALPERKTVKAALRSLNLSKRQVDALLRDGWRGLVTESEAELSELREAVERLGRHFKE